MTKNSKKEAVSLIIERNVYNKFEQEFIDCVAILNHELRTNPGFTGLSKYFERKEEFSKHTVILHFINQDYLHDYIASEVYMPVIERLDRISVDVHQRIEYGWFNVLSDGDLAQRKPPPQYKIAIVTWIVVFVLVVLVTEIFSWIGLNSKLPYIINTALSTLVVVLLMSYGRVMKLANKLFDTWINNKK